MSGTRGEAIPHHRHLYSTQLLPSNHRLRVLLATGSRSPVDAGDGQVADTEHEAKPHDTPYLMSNACIAVQRCFLPPSVGDRGQVGTTHSPN